MFKLAGCLMLIAAGAYGGFAASNDLKNRCEYIRQALKLTENIEIYLNSDYLTAEEMIEKLKGDNSLDQLDLKNYYYHDNITTELAEHIRQNKSCGCYEAALKLADFFEDFGKTDLNGQNSKTQVLKNELTQLYKENTDKYEKNHKLYQVLGISVGVLTALVLI